MKVLCNFVKLEFLYFEFVKAMNVVLKMFTIKSMKTNVVDFVYLTRKFIWT